MKNSDYKCYMLGYDEKTKEYEPFIANHYADSRIETLTKKLKESTKINNIHLSRLPYEEKKCILILTVQK